MYRRFLLNRVAWFAAIIFPTAHLLFADAAYRQSVEDWRQAYQASLTSDTGWLTVSGLFWLKEGANRFGSDPSNEIVLPSSAPPHAGVFEFHGEKTTARIEPGVVVTRNGTPVQTAELRPDVASDRLVLGDLTLYVHASGNRLAIRLKDKNSKLRKEFSGLHWFPVEESYHTTARYVPYESPKQLDSQNVLGDPIKLEIVGYLGFSLRGQDFHLEVEQNKDGGFFVVFRDLTAGKETYPASRFIDTEPPKTTPQGKTVDLDFNKAYNPPCAYNPFTTCPLPLPGNRMKIAIPAGEKIYKEHTH
ncbi:MAG TPA: DUF1684 domain-containing protein [Dongiaceae bacterium]|nr:DUF1684 domain-containing protein [Dongiaceae bacterium]